jgi:hypothetical protein
MTYEQAQQMIDLLTTLNASVVSVHDVAMSLRVVSEWLFMAVCVCMVFVTAAALRRS